MIDERHEELAALYALDLLEGEEKSGFEAALARDPALRKLVDELRESSAALAHLAPPVAPSPALKARLLAEIDAKGKSRESNQVIAFPNWIPWAAAACFAFALAWTGRLYFASRTETASTREQLALEEISVKSMQQQLEAERIIAKQHIAGLNQQVTETARQLADASLKLTSNERLLAEATKKSSATEDELSEKNRLLAEAGARLAGLQQQLKTQGDLANLKITTLASMLNNSPQAVAVAVWNPANQEGVLKVEKLPALAADKDYQLWVVDPQYPAPVDGGVFTVDPRTGEARFQFKSKQPVRTIAAFAVTLERKGGVAKAEGPFVLLGKEPTQ